MEPIEPIEGFLRQSLATETAPTLSPNFQQQLGARLQPLRIRKKQRQFLLAYSLTGLVVSMGVLRVVGFGWGLTLFCMFVPLVIVAAILWRHTLHFTRRRRI